MEVIFPWERDDVTVRSTADDSAEATSSGPGFAAMLASMSSQVDTEARVRSLADGVRAIERTSDMTTEEVLAAVETVLEEESTAEE